MEEGLKYRRSYEADWNEQEEFYQGLHYKQRDPSQRFKNHVFQLIEGEIPVLMDPMPATDVIAKDEDYADKAPILEASKDHVYGEQNLFMKDVQSIRDMLKTGNGWQFVDYDPDLDNGEGLPTVENLSWDQVVVDPAGSGPDEWRYAIVTLPLANQDLKRLYPKTAQQALNQPLKDVYQFNGSKYSREDQNTGRGGGSYDSSRYESKDMTYVHVCYLVDYSMEEIPDDQTQIELTEESAQLMQGINPDIHKWEDHEKHIQGHLEQKIIIAAQALQLDPSMVTEQDLEALTQDETISLLFNIIDDHVNMHKMHVESMDSNEIGKRPKYPNNLRLVVKTGQVVHFDDKPPVEDGLIPLVPFWCYKDRRPYADGAVKNLIPLQKTLNELDEKERRGLRLNANPGWMLDEQSGVDPDTLTDEDGIVVTKQQGTEVRRIEPGQVSPQLAMRVQREYEAMQRIEGVGEAVLGEAPKSVTSGTQLRRLQMQSLGRIRLKSKMIESAIYRRDRLILSRIIKYWSTERKLRVEDSSGKIQFIKFDPRDVQDFEYEVVLAPGTMSGMDNESIYETYKELLLAQAIDLKTFAQITNLPKKQALLDMIDQNDQNAAMMAQIQQENLQLKAQFAPQLLTPEEAQVIQEQAVQQNQANPGEMA